MTPQAIQQGVSLVLVLVMLVVLGVGAAATLQSALSTERLNTNSQQTRLASQQAEAALRSCEAELLKADLERLASLQEHNIPTTLYQKTPAWTLASTWQTAVKSSNAECVVERQVLADDKQVYVVTARGFGSASRSGTMGTVAWVQSTLLLGSP